MLAVEAIFVDAMRALAMVLDLDEGEKLNHAWRVGLLSLAIANEMAMPRPDLVYYAGLLHDIGAVGLSDHVIHHAQQGFKNPEARRHSEKGAHILRPFLALKGLDQVVADHHERHDGKGFPAGKAGSAIGLPAAVIHMSDILDVSLRSMPPETCHEKAFRVIRQKSGKAVTPDVAEAAAAVIARDRDWFEDLFEPEGPKTQAMAIHLAPPEVSRYSPGDLLGQVLWLFTRVIDAKNPAVMGHSVRVAWTASRIAETFASKELPSWDVLVAGLLHDVGVMALPRSLFARHAAATPKEHLRLARHAAYSMEVISHMRPVAHLALAAGSHHEHYDGSGYPHQSREEEIPLLGRLLAFSDFYDRLTGPGWPGRLSHEAAMKRMAEEKGKRLDPRLADAAFEALESCRDLADEPAGDLEGFYRLFSVDRADLSMLLKPDRENPQALPDPRQTKVSLLYQSFLVSNEPVLFTDPSGRVLDANRALLDLIGLGLDRVMGRSLEKLGLDFGKAGPGESRESTFTPQGSESLRFLVSNRLIRDTSGQSLGRIWNMSDITDRMKMELALTEKNRALAELNRMKSDMLAVTSHDMKSPLGGIIGYAGMIRDLYADLTDEEKLNYLDRIIASSRALVRFINDILDASRIESGSLKLYFGPTDLDPILRDLVLEQMAASQAREISLRYHAPQAPPPVRADKARIIQVLANLLSNAVKFSPQGGVVSVEYSLSRDGEHVVSVSDRGPGIPAKDVFRIFERYYQVSDNGGGKASQGSGLGLYIVKNLTESHGGRVTFENREGGGSVFTVTLPAHRPSGDKNGPEMN